MLKYTHITNLAYSRLLTDYKGPIVVTEKIHGTNCRFGVVKDKHDNWTFRIGGRNNWYFSRKLDELDRPETPDEAGYGFGMVGWFLAIPKFPEKVVDRWRLLGGAGYYVVYGEFYGGNIQKNVNYSNKKQFAAFDVKTPDKTYWPLEDAQNEVAALGLEYVPVLYTGSDYTTELLTKLRDQPSEIAKRHGNESISEGIVIKPIATPVYDHRGERLIAKYKSPEFTERKSTKSKQTISSEELAEVQSFVDEFFTDNRWTHICQIAESDYNLRIEPKSIGQLIKLMNEDIYRESEKERLETGINWKNCAKEISKRVAFRVTGKVC